MQLGMIGLGRMGANMATRLMKAGHECIVYDSHPEPVQALVKQGAKGSTDLTAFVKSLSGPRAVWLMVPAAAVDSVLVSLTPLLEPGDIVIDQKPPRLRPVLCLSRKDTQLRRVEIRPNRNGHGEPPFVRRLESNRR